VKCHATTTDRCATISICTQANTALQVGLLCASLSSVVWHVPGAVILDPLAYIVGTTTVVSGYDYYATARRHLHRGAK